MLVALVGGNIWFIVWRQVKHFGELLTSSGECDFRGMLQLNVNRRCLVARETFFVAIYG